MESAVIIHTQPAPATAGLLPVSRIRRNAKIDPRRGRNAADYQQFVESIRTHGVMQEILVRPVADGDPDHDYEIVFGNTRHSAAIDAGIEFIPARIEDMDDATARMMAAIENLQRADLTPVDEARHVVQMLADRANDHEAVMKDLGWSRTKLDSRILLSHASDAVADALINDQIKLGHAELLCRLPADDQEPVLQAIISKNYSVTDTRDRLLTLTRDLSTARFDTEQCRSCLHNSGANADLFEVSLGESRCQKADCWNEKTAKLIEVKLIEAKYEYGVAHTDLTLPQDGYVKLVARGEGGVGAEQLAACASCDSHGAVVTTTAGREGEVVGGYCFNRACNTEKRIAYKQLVAAATASPVLSEVATGTASPAQGADSASSSVDARQASVQNQTAELKKSGATLAKQVKPAQIRRSIRRQAFNVYAEAACKAIVEDSRLALAIAIVSTFFDLRRDIPSEIEKELSQQLGVKASFISDQRSELEARLAKKSQEELLTLLGYVASLTVKRKDNNDSFERSVSGSQSLAIMEHSNLDPTDFFQMNEAYLKAQVKAGIVEDCSRSGFAVKYNEANGDKAFQKLSSGKTDDLIKAILEFKDFDWKGYLPAALELEAQGGKAKTTP